MYRYGFLLVFVFADDFLKDLRLSVLEWKVDTLERQLADYEKRTGDLNISLQNQASVIVELCQRVGALERGTLLGVSAPLVARSTNQYAYWPRGYGPNK